MTLRAAPLRALWWCWLTLLLGGCANLPFFNDKTEDATGVESELSCVMGWQDIVARSALAAEIGRTAYVKTLCRRAATPTKPDAPR